MYVIEVIPLTALPHNAPQILSYFFDRPLEKGAVVQISLNNRKVNAVVIGSSLLESQKILLKKTGFQLKKLSSVISETSQVSPGQFQTALWLSKYYYAPLGLCLKTVLPPFFLKKKYKFKPETVDAVAHFQEKQEKPILILSSPQNALENLMPHIKKTAGNGGLASPAGGQVLFIVPEKINLEYLAVQLSEQYATTILHSGLSNKQYFEGWTDSANGKAQIIIGTRQALFLPFKNLRLIVVDDPLNSAYKSDMAPRYNTLELAKHIATIRGSQIIFTSSAIGVGNYNLIKNGNLVLRDKKTDKTKIRIVNTMEELKENNFSPLSRKLKEALISRVKQPNQKILIFSPRRGYSGIALCQNCGLAVKCPDCAAAMRVHKTTDFILICHRCSKSQAIPQFCANCNNYKIKIAGQAGSQKIYDEIRRLFERNNISGIPVLVLDSDIAKNETEEEEALEEIKKIVSPSDRKKTSVLVATQMVFSHRYQLKFDYIGVINADALANSPDYKTDEEFIYQMEKLKDFGPSEILVQTYNPEDAIFSALQEAKYDKFYGGELEARHAFSYPPFSRLIKLSFRHKNQAKASYEARLLSEKLRRAVAQMKLEKTAKIIDASPASVEKERGLYIFNLVLKISPEFENIRDILKFVPAGWSIDADPKTIL